MIGTGAAQRKESTEFLSILPGTNSAKSKKKEEAQFCTILHHTKPQKIRLLPANIN
jgi:hypothetical protein